MQKTAPIVDLETFLRDSFPSHSNLFTTEDVVRALADYTGTLHWEASLAVDLRQSHHTLQQVQTYATKIMMEKREISQEISRTMAMLQTNEDVFEDKEAMWQSGEDSTPLPVKPCVQKMKKICKQFRESGTCKFGSRCLYHHSAPLQGHAAESNATKASVGHSLGIMGRCVEKLQDLKVSSEAFDLHSKRRKPAVLAALPSSTNNYCSSPLTPPNATLKVTTEMPQDPSNPFNYTACSTFTAVGSVVMVPLSLPNGTIYGYAPLSLQMPVVQYPNQ
ncbi:hypothetical protein TraAM80_03901 [Trypanosoma rangeli]|uniref:C3H1-type domain-containing protein n=1 Tax=Trypanosoma rangeli TaxID=5698 RepID=A0A3R7RLC7_TRYRA|nr:uncharacterized protein TraAM80_03901 [Trypanosoma rangeli]RNF06434.1 hypothetical protein TraAM80_03901 [Trypanosoma rangeli]|eukprot:RNF06434.1 hypothetical protein TraAM80_03901 [Trypanosoma rangeli]